MELPTLILLLRLLILLWALLIRAIEPHITAANAIISDIFSYGSRDAVCCAGTHSHCTQPPVCSFGVLEKYFWITTAAAAATGFTVPMTILNLKTHQTSVHIFHFIFVFSSACQPASQSVSQPANQQVSESSARFACIQQLCVLRRARTCEFKTMVFVVVFHDVSFLLLRLGFFKFICVSMCLLLPPWRFFYQDWRSESHTTEALALSRNYPMTLFEIVEKGQCLD